MKSFLIGLLALGTVSAYASSECVDSVMEEIAQTTKVEKVMNKLESEMEAQTDFDLASNVMKRIESQYEAAEAYAKKVCSEL